MGEEVKTTREQAANTKHPFTVPTKGVQDEVTGRRDLSRQNA